MSIKHIKVVFIVGCFFWFGTMAQGQSTNGGSQNPLPPVAPISSDKTVGGSMDNSRNSADGDTRDILPDSRPLWGAQELTLGTSAAAQSFLLPSFSVLTLFGTDPSSVTNSATPTVHPETFSNTILAGRLGVNEVSARSAFLLDYIAGGSFSNDPTVGDSLIQGLDASETFLVGRWTVTFADKFTYYSNSLFGGGSFGGFTNLGTGLGNGVGTSPGISSTFAPGESFDLNGLTSISNTTIGQTSYSLTHRAKLTFVGSYSELDFHSASLRNSQSASFQGGYEYLLSRENTLGVSYRFDGYEFSGLPQSIHNNRIQGTFGRRITGRLSVEIGGGPAIQQYQNPLTGSATLVRPTVFAALNYRLRYTAFVFNYTHGLTNGSGLLPGAETDTLTGIVRRSFGKNWDSSLNAGYSRNVAIQQTLANANGLSPNTWFVTPQLNRHFVGYGALFLSYTASGQSNLSTICTLPGCNIRPVTHSVSVGYTWGLRPVPLE